MDKKYYLGLAVLGFFAFIVMVGAVIPNNTLQNNWLVVTNINVTGDYHWRSVNLTAAFEEFINGSNVNEWGLVYGTTGDWFNYTTITQTPVYIGLQMHPLNLTIGGEYVIANVYDKDDTHWQLELVWMGNGTQCTKDCLVMYYAHVDWNNEDGLEYILPNQGEPA